MLLAALPTKWDHVATIYLQGKNNITAVTSASVRQAIVAKFDQTSGGERQQVHKISAIKRKGEHPKWKGNAPTNKSSSANDEPSGSNKNPKSVLMLVKAREKVRLIMPKLNSSLILLP